MKHYMPTCPFTSAGDLPDQGFNCTETGLQVHLMGAGRGTKEVKIWPHSRYSPSTAGLRGMGTYKLQDVLGQQ